MSNKKKFGDNKTDWMVLAFVVGMALMLGYCDSAVADFSIEEQHDSNGGATAFNQGLDRICGRWMYADEKTSLYLCPIVAVGGDLASDSWELGLAEKFGKWEGEIRINSYDAVVDGGGTVRRLIGTGPFQLGLGLTYWINDSPGSNSSVTFNLSMRYTF